VTITIEITDNKTAVTTDTTAGTKQTTTTKTKETATETDAKEAETKKEVGVMTNKVISTKSIPRETEITRGDNIEMNSQSN